MGVFDFPHFDKMARNTSHDNDKQSSSGSIPKPMPLINTIGNDERYVFKPIKKMGTKRKIFFSALLSLLFLYFARIYLWVFLHLGEFQTQGAGGLALALLVILMNVMIIRKAVNNDHFMKRYAKYFDAIGLKKAVLVENLANSVSLTNDEVYKDLSKAVKDHLIPHGHFVLNNGVFIVSDEAYQEYLDKQVEYDQVFSNQANEEKDSEERDSESNEQLQTGQDYVECPNVQQESSVSQNNALDPTASHTNESVSSTDDATRSQQTPDNKDSIIGLKSSPTENIDKVTKINNNKPQAQQSAAIPIDQLFLHTFETIRDNHSVEKDDATLLLEKIMGVFDHNVNEMSKENNSVDNTGNPLINELQSMTHMGDMDE